MVRKSQQFLRGNGTESHRRAAESCPVRTASSHESKETGLLGPNLAGHILICLLAKTKTF
ncbi:MAG: hypothetical protein DMG06_08065 [Acidobacteria bacterium]|nr:MAG: hypothetical protein DMG06_08065 [Acidobacteriota bacterium]